MAQSTMCVSDRISAAETALLTSKECQQNGLLPEAVMSTVESLEHIECGLCMSPTDDENDHLNNLQFKANVLLDCLQRMSRDKAEVDELTSLVDLMSADDAGLQELHHMSATNYRQCDSSRTVIYAMDSELIHVKILKVIRPRLIYYLQLTADTGNDTLYTIPLRDQVAIQINKNLLEIQLPDYSNEGIILFTVPSAETLQTFIDQLDEYLIPYNCEEEEVAVGTPAQPDTYPHNLVRGASIVSNGLKRGAEKTGQFLTWGTPYVISKLAKSDSVEVSEGWRTTATVAKSVTTTAASVTGTIADKLGSATMALGRFLAPHAHQTGSRLLVHAAGVSEEDASEKVNGVLNFTAGAVAAVATVVEGIEESVKVIGSSIGENSGKIIEHKYGPQAASVATDTFETIGNVYTISKNTKILKPKNILKSTVKNTGKGILQEISVGDVQGTSTGEITDGQPCPLAIEEEKEKAKEDEGTKEHLK